jgi:hypothetical protein
MGTVGVVPQTSNPPPPQNAGAAQVPQLLIRFPQPSPAAPQVNPSVWQVFGTHTIGPPSGRTGTELPHWKGVPPPPQVCPVGHVPHWS